MYLGCPDTSLDHLRSATAFGIESLPQMRGFLPAVFRPASHDELISLLITARKDRTVARMVFYHETDRMDIVNHSNYIHMAEEARVDFMEKIGIGYSRMEEQGIMLPVLGVTCEYKHSLHFGEHLAAYDQHHQRCHFV